MTADTLAPAPSQQDGAAPARGLTVREALRDALAEEMRADASVFLIGEDVAEARGAFGVSDGLLDEFGPRRVVDVPVAEAGFAGLAVGAAFAGLRPVVEFSNFSFALQAMDQIVNSAARTRYMSGGALSCPIVFRGPSGAAPRAGAQHAQDFAAWFAHIPGLKVVQPYSAADAKGLLKSAIRDPDPVVFLENETLYARTFAPVDDGVAIPLGKARIWQEGTDVTLVSFGVAMARTLEAARALAREGVSAEVIDLRCLRPLDHGAVLASVRKTNRCVTVEEGLPVCSIGDHLGATIMREAFDWLDAPVLSVTGADVPMPYAESLEALALPSARDVVEAARAVCGR